MDLGDASEAARHSESSGTDAARQRVLTGDARIWTAWNFAAHGRRDTPADVESLIKELLRLIRSKIKLRALVRTGSRCSSLVGRCSFQASQIPRIFRCFVTGHTGHTT